MRSFQNAGAAQALGRRSRLRLETYGPSQDVPASPPAAAAVLRISCVRRGQELFWVPQELARQHSCAARAVFATALAQVMQHP